MHLGASLGAQLDDLEAVLRRAIQIMTPEQREALRASEEVQRLLSYTATAAALEAGSY